jgi:hypothetical protein
MLNVIMPSVVMLKFVMLSVIMLSVIMLKVVILSVIMLSVVFLPFQTSCFVDTRNTWTALPSLSSQSSSFYSTSDTGFITIKPFRFVTRRNKLERLFPESLSSVLKLLRP